MMGEIIQQFQPKGSSQCGQTCVAMILAVSLERAIQMVGTKGPTTGPMLSKVLSSWGFSVSPSQLRLPKARMIPRNADIYKELPWRCIVKVRSVGQKKCHWILVWEGETFDPYPGHVPWEYISGYIEIYEAAA